MFCPKCATQNVDGASFCRACGANISLVPQALTGQLPTAPQDDYSNRELRRRKRRGREPSLDEGIRHLMMGIGFVVVSILISKYSPAGHIWWYWMLIPAFTFLGRGIADLVRVAQLRSAAPKTQSPPQISAPGSFDNLPSRSTAALMPPVPSVTEGTTRHLGAEAPTRHFDSATGEQKLH
jgi:hypothetical protein